LILKKKSINQFILSMYVILGSDRHSWTGSALVARQPGHDQNVRGSW
jgi:hypothetical protein